VLVIPTVESIFKINFLLPFVGNGQANIKNITIKTLIDFPFFHALDIKFGLRATNYTGMVAFGLSQL
jgi:hypothetical protein